MGNLDFYYWILLGILGFIEGFVLFVFHKKGVSLKIIIPVFLLLLTITAVMIVPAVHYPISKNPRIPENVRQQFKNK